MIQRYEVDLLNPRSSHQLPTTNYPENSRSRSQASLAAQLPRPRRPCAKEEQKEEQKEEEEAHASSPPDAESSRRPAEAWCECRPWEKFGDQSMWGRYPTEGKTNR